MSTVQLLLPGQWADAQAIRGRVEAALAGLPEEFRQASAMVAAELMENAVKYGDCREGVAFTIDRSSASVRIHVSTLSGNPQSVREVEEKVGHVKTVEASREVYQRRMAELGEDASTPGKLGLYRIALEGEFTLTCGYQGSHFWVAAARELP